MIGKVESLKEADRLLCIARGYAAHRRYVEGWVYLLKSRMHQAWGQGGEVLEALGDNPLDRRPENFKPKGRT